MLHESDVPPEEKEKWSLDRERDADAINDYMKVERVIGSREGEEDTEYFVKCRQADAPTRCSQLTTMQGKDCITTLAPGKRRP